MTSLATEQLANGNWPEVVAIFGYRNPRAPRTSDAEYERLIAVYQRASCPNMAKFIEQVQFSEKEQQVTVSFNLVLFPREVDTSQESTRESVVKALFHKDLLVGTRKGIEGAAVWFENLVPALEKSAPDAVQVMDKIFGEALPHFETASRSVDFEDLFRFAFGGEELPHEAGNSSRH